MKKTTIVLYTSLFILIGLIACKKNNINEDLSKAAKKTDLTFYQNKDTIYDAKGGSPHGQFKLKFNSVALANLGADGKLPVGGTFSEGAIIVKESWVNGSLALIVVMKKDSKTKYNANNWLWGEYNPDGSTKYSVAEKGKNCTGCHSAGTNRDLTKSFDLH
jgi:hypothetical protein